MGLSSGSSAGAVVIAPISLSSMDALLATTASAATKTTWAVTKGGLDANTAILIPFVLQAEVTLRKIVILQNDEGICNVDVGVYSDSLSRLVSSGSTAITSADPGNKQLLDVADTTLPAGRYFMAYVVDTFLGSTGYPVFQATTGTYNPHPLATVLEKTSSFPLPSSISSPTVPVISRSIPFFSLNFHTLI